MKIKDYSSCDNDFYTKYASKLTIYKYTVKLIFKKYFKKLKY